MTTWVEVDGLKGRWAAWNVMTGQRLAWSNVSDLDALQLGQQAGCERPYVYFQPEQSFPDADPTVVASDNRSHTVPVDDPAPPTDPPLVLRGVLNG